VTLPPLAIAVVSTGVFWRLFAPMSVSPASLAVMPLLPRSMPKPRLAKIELFWMRLPVPDATATPILPLLAMIFPSPAAVPPIALLAAAVICTLIEL